MFKKLNVPTRQDKNYLLKYRTYSSICSENLTFCNNTKSYTNNNKSKSDISKFNGSNIKIKNDNIIEEDDKEKKPFNYRTLLCKFFLVNACTRGNDCAYSHDTSQFPCKAHFLRHNCKRKNCLFSHDPDKLDKLDEPFEDTTDINVESPFF